MFGQQCMNTPYKLRGYFYVGSAQKDSLALGGFYADKNIPKNTNSTITKLSKKGTLNIIAKTDSLVALNQKVQGFKVFIVNTSDSIMELPAQDSRIYLKRQVYYNNKWQDVEYLPSSWCGNSYRSVFIKPDSYWDLSAPCLTGKIAAKFRFELLTNDNRVIHSNEFAGSFNKSQLKKEEGHQPQGIMDPYNN